MGKDSKRKCPDCDYNLSIYAVLDKGDGRCRNCDGTGEVADPLVEFFTLGVEKGDTTCKVCSGTGQCQTCGGTGYEYYYDDDDNNETENRSSDNYDYDFEYAKMPTSRIQLRNSNEDCLFDYDYNQKTPHFYYSHYLIREKLTNHFLLTYDEIQILMKNIIEKYFNLSLSLIDIECFINCDQADSLV